MAKAAKSSFVCQNCGAVSNRWAGKCVQCREWNAIVEETDAGPPPGSGITKGSRGRVVALEGLTGKSAEAPRIPTGNSELDRVTGGGIVPGSALLIGGEPGIGKSTLLLQLSAALLDSSGVTKMRRPDFFIVGAPKCGTTAMIDYLKQHPEVFVPDRKELDFFGRDLVFKGHRLTEEEYLGFFSRATAEKRAGEGSVWYLHSKTAALEIKDFSPNARIIIMLRNPLDMMYSFHSQRLYNGNEDIENFSAALDAEAERTQHRVRLRLAPARR